MTRTAPARPRVLLADHDQNILDLLVELLEVEGYEVESALDGQTALEMVRTFQPDLVISDVVMPIIGGIELCRRLKSDASLSEIPVLLISGLRNTEDDNLEGLTAGADDYLDLP